MADERAHRAIQRIEQALARIDAAATQRPAPARDEGDLVALRATHQALRTKVESAITQIDRLLETEVR